VLAPAPGVGIDDKYHALTGQLVGHLEAIALKGDSPVLAHLARETVIEQLIEVGGALPQGADMGQILAIAFQRRASLQTGVCCSVIDALDPRPKACVQVAQILDPTEIELAQKLIAKGAVPALELGLSLRTIRTAVDQMDVQPGTDPLQRLGAIGATVVDHQARGPSPFQDRLFEHPLDVQSTFTGAEGTVGDQA